MKLHNTLGPAEWEEFLTTAIDAQVIKDGQKDGGVVTFIMLDGERKDLGLMDACPFAHELNAQIRRNEVSAAKRLNKPDLLAFASEHGIDVMPGQTKPTILDKIINWIEVN